MTFSAPPKRSPVASGPPSSVRSPGPASGPSSARTAGDLLEPLLALLARYVSLATAQSVLALARRRTGIHGAGLDCGQLREMLGSIEHGLRMFITDPKLAADCSRGLMTLASGQPVAALPEALTLDVRIEDDVARVRRDARDFAALRGFSQVGQTRLTTAVSELARNIVQYAGVGQLEIKATSAPAGLEIVARDRGPGIPNLDQIMAGNYRSKLGMGLGLLGVKKLADRFDVQTAPGRGTTVTFSMKVV